MTKPLRQTMPTIALWIDEMRDAFGAEMINAAIRAGIDGQPAFWASEGGVEIGTRAKYSAEKVLSLAEIQIGPFNTGATPGPCIEIRKGKRRG